MFKTVATGVAHIQGAPGRDQDDHLSANPSTSKWNLKATNTNTKLTKSKSKRHHFLTGYMGFKSVDKKRKELLIPKDRQAWLEYLLFIVKKKVRIEYLTDKELRKVIIRARKNLGTKKILPVVDPDAPACIQWSVEETAEWICEAGFPYLKETFIANKISGRRLVLTDCSALCRLGMTDLSEMRKVTEKIRTLLDIPPPNFVRALMRIPPFEMYLRSRVSSGSHYDAMTFEKFCKAEGFDYSLWARNKNALIPCTCEVRIVPKGVEDGSEDGGDEEDSLLNASTVEYVVRNLAQRDKTVQAIIEGVVVAVFERSSGRKTVHSRFHLAMQTAYGDLGPMTSEERLEFSTKVAEALLIELRRTTEVLHDMDLLRKYIKAEVTQEKVDFLQEKAEVFMENVMPIASLLALGELDLETIFRQEPEFIEFVDDVVLDAEDSVNKWLPEALDFVDSVIQAAETKVKTMGLPGLSVSQLGLAKELIKKSLEEVREEIHAEVAPKTKEESVGDDKGMSRITELDDEDTDKELVESASDVIVAESTELALTPEAIVDPGEVKGKIKSVTKASIAAAASINKQRQAENKPKAKKDPNSNENN